MDLYVLLGVARDATVDEIERAYRRLARRYHPGVNPGDRLAEARFREIQQAFEVLGQTEPRAAYDRGTNRAPAPETERIVSFDGFDFSAAAEGPLAATFSELFADVFQEAARQVTAPARGAALEAIVHLTFENAVRGGSYALSILRQERCGTCGGDGRVGRAPMSCPICAGTGGRRWARGHLVFSQPCDACDASGQVTREPCPSCGGIGIHPRSEVVRLTIPPGAEAGQRLVVPGRGHAGAHGGTPGDLYVTLEVAPHPVFRRAGRDLHVTLPVAVHEAALGARVDVPTLGEPARLRIPPGTPSGRHLRLRGLGVPAAAAGEDAGDLVAEVQIVLPPVRDERSRELLREFGRLNDVDVRAELFGTVGPKE